MRRKSFRLFLLVSLLIACTDALFIWINYRSAKRSLEEGYATVGKKVHASFEQALDASETRMLQITTFTAADHEVQQLFLAGRDAVLAEGGAAGGREAARIRKLLYERVGPSREALAREFDFRQLHFHLGPGSLSFLRVHEPDKYGDRMDNVRYTIVAANEEQVPTKGFETGRVISGIRGVVPVFATDAEGGRTHVGALEAGISFQVTLEHVARRQEVGLAVLLTVDHLRANIWPQYLENMLKKHPPRFGLMVEASTDPVIDAILADEVMSGYDLKPGLKVSHATGRPLCVSSFPLRDFLGERDPALPPVGLVAAWWDASEEIAAFQRGQRINLAYGLGGFLLVELLLFIGIRSMTSRFALQVSEQTRELKVVRRESEQSEDRFRTMIDFSIDWEEWIRPDGSFEYVSPSCERITGYERERFMDNPDFLYEIVHPDDLERLREHRARHMDEAFERAEIHFRVLARDGEERWIWHHCQPVRDRDEVWAGRRVTNREVTAQHRVEEALRVSENRLGLAIESADLGLYDWNVVTGALTCNERWASMLGYAPGEIDPHIRFYRQHVHPDDAREVQARLDAHFADQNHPFEFEHRMRTRQGEWIWVLARARVIARDEEGRPLRVVGAHLDVSQRRRQEVQRVQNARQQEQMARFQSLRVMAGAIAHRFNNAMMAVMGNLDILAMILPKESEEREIAAQAMQAARGASQVGGMMLTYVGNRVERLDSGDISAPLAEAVAELRKGLATTVDLRVNPPPLPMSCRFHGPQLREVFLNILANAVESLPDQGGAVTVDFDRGSYPASAFPMPFCQDLPELADYVFCRISDTGHGINEADLEHVFDPFFSTRFVGRGLGLAMAAGIVQAHHGAITVESRVGRGTVVRVLLPVVEAPEPEPEPDNEKTAAVRERFSGQALLADDDGLVLSVGARMLGQLGLTVTTAASGEEAVEKARALGDSLTVCILDVAMPGMDGIEAMAEIRRLVPGVPVLLSSGFRLEDLPMDQAGGEQAGGFLQKPFRLAEMHRRLDEILD